MAGEGTDDVHAQHHVAGCQEAQDHEARCHRSGHLPSTQRRGLVLAHLPPARGSGGRRAKDAQCVLYDACGEKHERRLLGSEGKHKAHCR